MIRQSLAIILLLYSSIVVWGKQWGIPRVSRTKDVNTALKDQLATPKKPTSKLIEKVPRGGTSEDDEERYSRQVYTLGARAHGLVRSATVYVDGPSTSGLMYEAVKNLALSGIGKIVVLTSQEDHDEKYYISGLDDLGNAYVRGAQAEIGIDDKDNHDKADILVEFLNRLNPSLQVERMERDTFDEKKKEKLGILLCVDRPYDTQVQLSKICRKHQVPFVSVETAGVHGRAFSDFGSEFEIHDADGEPPLVVPLDRLEVLSKEERTYLVRCVEGERHDASKGDEIKFQLSNGEKIESASTVINVQTPERLIVQLSSHDTDFEKFIEDTSATAASFSRIKKTELMNFVPLEDATSRASNDSSLFTPCDLDKSFDEVRRGAIFSSFQALNLFVKEEGRIPNIEDVSKFMSIAKNQWEGFGKNKEWTSYCTTFVRNCAAKFVPLQALFGAVAAQECLKAASGLYNPIHQFLIYDCDEVVPLEASDKRFINRSHCSGLAYILGEDIYDALRNQKIFVVGSGAIGCEILKNLAAMQAGTGKKGTIILTDMDTIEKSNLSRQLLFRDADISKFKSKAAQEAVARLNPSVKIDCHTSKVGDEETGPFDSKFWSKKVDVVLNALDNMDARLYMDGQCVTNEKALVDAGTLGSKGNVQVVVPHMSESYGSSADPPEPAIPVCTLKNFPYAISHTIQWGRDMFDGLFVRRPKQANQYAELLAEGNLHKIEKKLEQDLGSEAARDAAKELAEDLLLRIEPVDSSETRRNAISWAVSLAHELFNESIQKLLKEHPVDSVDDDGEPFWSGSRKTPNPLIYREGDLLDDSQKIVNQNLVDFVKHATRLRLETVLGTTECASVTDEEARNGLTEKVAKNQTPSGDSGVKEILEPIDGVSQIECNLNVAEFEKDDDSNGHVAFITAASNLRAICYGIPPVDAMETRRVAGRIVPAMITTTAFVSGLSCIELLKLVQGLSLERYRNAFINLALPFFAFTAPLPADKFDGLQGNTYSLWDRITVKEGKKAAAAGGITLRQFLKRVKKKATSDPDSIEVSSISFGEFMIYANFLNSDDDELLDKNLWTVVEEAISSGDDFDSEFSRSSDEVSGQKSLDKDVLVMTVIVEDEETGEEIELPPVRVIRSS